MIKAIFIDVQKLKMQMPIDIHLGMEKSIQNHESKMNEDS